MNCRQNHGFIYEKNIVKKFNLIKSLGHTSKYDAYTQDGIPVQIKCIKTRTSVSFGDFQRNQNHQTPFILIVGFWQSSKGCIIKEHILMINHEIFSNIVSFGYTDIMLEEMKKISNSHSDDDKWKEFRKKWKKIYPASNLVSLYFKRDHKLQTRIQCGISYKKFTTNFLKLFKCHKLIAI